MRIAGAIKCVYGGNLINRIGLPSDVRVLCGVRTAE